jgi:hypothetical protein
MPPNYTVDLSPDGGGPPEPPVKVPMGGAGGLVYATGSVEILGNAADAALEILGYYFGLEQTTPLEGKTMAESYAIALAAEINAFWNDGDIRPTASVTGATVHLTAGIGGIIGNLVNITSSDSNVVPSDDYLSGGGGDSTIHVSGTFTKNGTTPVVFPPLAHDVTRGGEMPEYNSLGSSYDLGGPPFTGWYYELNDGSVFTGTFPDLVLEGYRWSLTAKRYDANVFQEQAVWTSAVLPTRHPAEDATGWAPVSPATGTPVIGNPTGGNVTSPPDTVAMSGAGGGSPSAPHTVPMTGTGGGSPDAPDTVPL